VVVLDGGTGSRRRGLVLCVDGWVCFASLLSVKAAGEKRHGFSDGIGGEGRRLVSDAVAISGENGIG
jgi:hypothetical protein